MTTATRRQALNLGATLVGARVGRRTGSRAAEVLPHRHGWDWGHYYPIGGLIGNAISSDSVNVSAVATNGSVANVNGIVAGSMESGFSQADVNFWAFTGTGIY
jgi:uncharacterized protein